MGSRRAFPISSRRSAAERMSRPISLDRNPSSPPTPEMDSSEQPPTDAPAPKARSWFRKTVHGVRWLAATPADWLGTSRLSNGVSLIGRLASAARAGGGRDQRFRVEDRGAFDLQATAFSYGVSAAALEARLASRRRQTAVLAYALFALAWIFLLAWMRSALHAPLNGPRLLVALEFLPFCCLFFLLSFYNALINFQIRMRRSAGWREYLTTDEAFFPRG